MAYVIKIDDITDATRANITHVIKEAAKLEGFDVRDIQCRPSRKVALIIELRTIRLLVAKPYCGNHAGPCVRPQPGPPRKSKCLEGADWIKFHDIINTVLDTLDLAAEVYTLGGDVYPIDGYPLRKLVIRSASTGARTRYDYKNLPSRGFGGAMVPHYAWNPGTPDQFTSGDRFTSEEIG